MANLEEDGPKPDRARFQLGYIDEASASKLVTINVRIEKSNEDSE